MYVSVGGGSFARCSLIALSSVSTHEGCPRFNWEEDALEPWNVLILEITLPLETQVNLSVNGHQLSAPFRILSVVNFEILESENLLLIFSLIFKLHEKNQD